jgi:predicted ArsR family transcriptional regulator
METRLRLLQHLKKHGPCSVQDLKSALEISENAVRHHLSGLERPGFVEVTLERSGVGRPAKRYGLSLAAEGLFPKRYQELLELVLQEAEARDQLEEVLDGVVARMAAQVAPELEGLTGEDRLQGLAHMLDFGNMLADMEATQGGWELRAYNCSYRDTGFKFEAVCNLMPRVITRLTGLPAERLACQRDSERACHFTVGRRQTEW